MKRKPSSDGGQRIRKWDRQLSQASEGRHGAFARRANPTEVWNKVARRRKGSRMRRLAGGERSTRFEPASQYSQLPLQVEQSRKTEGSQGAMCGPQGKRSAGTPERSNPIREQVKRKSSSDGGRRIRKWDRKLSQASEGRHGAFARRANPTEVWNKVARRRKGSRMRRLAGGERSTRFEPASQHSQLPLLRTGVFLLNRLLMLVYAKRFLKPIRRLFLKRQKS